jgi:hypothetical protein
LVSFAATAGQQYLVRVGSYPDDPPVGGPGAVSIHCGIDVCPAEGECTAANGSPGCSDQGCCETVCAADAYCCESEWDALCAQEAVGFCGTGFAACGRGAGSCSEANGSAGCDDVDCCNAVCQEDSFCCVSDWDDLCAAAEPTTCFSSCTASAGACTGVHAIPGCEDASCCAEVCPRDSFCCEFEWDAGCVELANEFCTP